MSPVVDLVTPLVACIDGPLKNQWFTEDDWRARIEAAQYMAEKHSRPAGHPAASCLKYVPSGRTIPHPSQDGRSGRELVTR